MSTIPHPAPPLDDDVRLVAARNVLAELPEADENERPYFWIGRLKTALRQLVDGWPSGTSGGLDNGQREVLTSALADAIAFRQPDWCVDCAAHADGECCDHLADRTLACAYQALGRELGLKEMDL